MLITRRQAVETYNASLLKNVKNTLLNFDLVKNRALLKPIVDAVDEVSKKSDNYLEFEKENSELCIKHCDKDEKNQPITTPIAGGIRFSMEKNKEEFERDFLVLKEKFKEAIETQEKRLKQMEELLDGKEEISLIKVKLTDLAAAVEGMDTATLEALSPLIEE